jgi:hypothetical protein
MAKQITEINSQLALEIDPSGDYWLRLRLRDQAGRNSAEIRRLVPRDALLTGIASTFHDGKAVRVGNYFTVCYLISDSQLRISVVDDGVFAAVRVRDSEMTELYAALGSNRVQTAD